jgi:hypothetical protein
LRKKPHLRNQHQLAYLFLIVLAFSLSAQETQTAPSSAEKFYRPKSQIFSIKSEIFGGEFRITSVIPLHGDFSKYQVIEIPHLKSLVGSAIPDKVLKGCDEKVFHEFQTLSKLKKIVSIDDYNPSQPHLNTQSAPVDVDNPEEQDSLDGPMLTMADLRRFDKVRSLKEAGLPVPGEPQRSLVILGEVLDYEKGNHILQYFPLNLGSTIFTIRFRYFDKQTGDELGRQVITGEVSSDTIAGFVGLHSALKGVVEGLADQVTRRVLESEQ